MIYSIRTYNALLSLVLSIDDGVYELGEDRLRPMLLQPATVRTEVMGRSRQADEHPLSFPLLIQIMCIILEYSCDIASIDVIRVVTLDHFPCSFVEYRTLSW